MAHHPWAAVFTPLRASPPYSGHRWLNPPPHQALCSSEVNRDQNLEAEARLWGQD